MKKFSILNALISATLVAYLYVHVFVIKIPTMIHGIVLLGFFIVYVCLWVMYVKDKKFK